MYLKLLKTLLCLAFCASLTACGAFFDKDNMPAAKPLVKFTPEVKPHLIWSAHTGAGTSDDYLKLRPAINDQAIFIANANGQVVALNKHNGRTLWKYNTRLPITTSPGIGDNLVVVGSREGDVMALDETSGRMIWKASMQSEVLATPSVGEGKVIVKTIDGHVSALAGQNGNLLWTYQQTEPSLILRGASTPRLYGNNVIVGFANGKLSKLNGRDGVPVWTQTIAVPEGAFSIERMIDIDADPLIDDGNIYAATYQGNVASLDWVSGRTIWSHSLSSYTGMVATGASLYITDARSKVWSFNSQTGNVIWEQDDLGNRGITAPASQFHFIVVGDNLGYLHWLNKNDGHLAAREYLGGNIYAAPVVHNNVLYAINNKGYLAAYTLGL